jgi:hypothetical protein
LPASAAPLLPLDPLDPLDPLLPLDPGEPLLPLDPGEPLVPLPPLEPARSGSVACSGPPLAPLVPMSAMPVPAVALHAAIDRDMAAAANKEKSRIVGCRTSCA